MTMSKAKANGKKNKFKAFIKKNEVNDSDGSITSDDVDDLEDGFVGKVIKDEYIIIKYINRGTFSRVWLAYHTESDSFRVLKIYFEKEIDEFDSESNMLDYLSEFNLQHNIPVIETFTYSENGNVHNTIVLPYMGYSIFDIMECNKDDEKQFSLDEVKYISRKLLLSINELHNNGVLHTDIKLDNLLTNYFDTNNINFNKWLISLDIPTIHKKILEDLIPDDYQSMSKDKRKKTKRKIKHKAINGLSEILKGRLVDYQKLQELETEESEHPPFNITNLDIKLIDYSNSIKIENADSEEEYQIRAFRAPENIMGYPLTTKMEVWTIGCFFWKLLTGQYIFEPELIGDTIRKDREQLWKMYTYLGPIDLNYTMGCDRSHELFEDTGKVKGYKKVHREYIDDLLKTERTDIDEKERLEISNFLNTIWNYNPKKRYPIQDCLYDPFMVV